MTIAIISATVSTLALIVMLIRRKRKQNGIGYFTSIEIAKIYSEVFGNFKARIKPIDSTTQVFEQVFGGDYEHYRA